MTGPDARSISRRSGCHGLAAGCRRAMSSSGETDGLLDAEAASEGAPDLEPEEMRETSAAHACVRAPTARTARAGPE